MVRVVTNDQVRALLEMDAALDVLESAYRADAAGRAVNIPRSDMILPVSTDEAYVFKVMPGAIADFGVTALRSQSDRIRWGGGRKEKRGMARDGKHTQYVQLYDTETTEPILVMPDGFASKVRVGGANAIAAKYLAPPGPVSIGLIGSGRQAGGQVWAFDTALDVEEIRVYSTTAENREGFSAEWDTRLDADVVPVESARGAVRGADILASATNSMEPVFEVDWIDPGMHVSAIKMPEVPNAVYDHADHVVVHSHVPLYGPNNYAPRDSGWDDRLDDTRRVPGFDLSAVPDLPTAITSDRDRGTEETTFFMNNLGVGIQFAALGHLVFEAAEANDVGREIDTDLFLQSMW